MRDVAQILARAGTNSELIGINPEKVIERERRKVGTASNGNAQVRLLQAGLRRSQLRAFAGDDGLNLIKRDQGHLRLQIVDEDGKELPPAQTGEIVKHSPTVMQGYFKNPAATAQALKGGWLYTGDLGYLDGDGFLFFVDRKKDMVRRGDENISSEEVERVLNSHPLIAESAVVGVPDAIRGEEVKAYIALKPSTTPENLPPEQIWAFCKEHLAPFKVPRFLEYREELPKTPSSKIQKNILRQEGKLQNPVVFDHLAREQK